MTKNNKKNYVSINKKKSKFLQFYIEYEGNVSRAARESGISRSTAMRLVKTERFVNDVEFITGYSVLADNVSPKTIMAHAIAQLNTNIFDFLEPETGEFKAIGDIPRECWVGVTEYKRKTTKYGTDYSIKIAPSAPLLSLVGGKQNVFKADVNPLEQIAIKQGDKSFYDNNRQLLKDLMTYCPNELEQLMRKRMLEKINDDSFELQINNDGEFVFNINNK